MFAEKDPSEDRGEFERRLDSIFGLDVPIKDVVIALLLDDEEKIAEYKASLEAGDVKKADYLAQWDTASDKAAKMAIVGSVKH